MGGLLGISAGSLVGSGIIKSCREDADPEQVEQAGHDPNPAALADLKNEQDVNEEAQQASLSDLFKGELVGSRDYLEVGKVQMFFTLLVVFAYGSAIAAAFDNADETIVALPDLSAGILALLAISLPHRSHGGRATHAGSPAAQLPDPPNVSTPR